MISNFAIQYRQFLQSWISGCSCHYGNRKIAQRCEWSLDGVWR